MLTFLDKLNFSKFNYKKELKYSYYFKSNLFEITEDETEETNPGVFGKSVSYWLKEQLSQEIDDDLDVFPEDWGWCISYKTNILICITNIYDETNIVELDKDKIVWYCFVNYEKPLIKNKRKEMELELYCNEIGNKIESILKSNSNILILNESEVY